jgi:cytochrome c oxidase subunit 2
MKTMLRCLVLAAFVVASGTASAQPAPRTTEDKPAPGSAAPDSAAQPTTPTPAGSAGSAAPTPSGAAAGGTAAPATGTAPPISDVPPANEGAVSGKGPEGAQSPGTSTSPPNTPGGKSWYDLLADKKVEDMVDGTYWMPRSVNEPADASDMMFYAVLALSIFFFLAITVATVYFVWKYRHRPGHKPEPSSAHNDALEITWTVIPTIIVVFLFWYGWRSYIHVVTPPTKAVEIQVLAWRWNWQFTHANGVTDSDLHIPANTPVRLVMTSKDVLHAFYSPSMRVKQDLVPRRYTHAWVKATKPGTYRLNCAEYCGTSHAQMGCLQTDAKTGACLRRAVVVVHGPGDYERYLADKQAEGDKLPPEQLGQKVYEKKGCNACHTVDGGARVGPTFKGIYGTQATMADGSKVPVDENYIRESLMSPQAKGRPGFPPSMPSFQGQLKENEIVGIIAYIKSLK